MKTQCLSQRPATRAIALCAGLLCFGATPAFAQSATYSTRGQAAASAQPAVNPVIERLQIRVDTLDAEVRNMTGRLETMGFELNQARNQAEAASDRAEAMELVIETLEARISALEAVLNAPLAEAAGASGEPASTEVALVGPTDPATREALANARGADSDLASKAPDLDLSEDPAELYQQARSLLLKGDFPKAEQAFSAYMDRHSDLENAGEAQYWLGETLLVQDAYPEAVEAYVMLLSNYPDADKAPDGLVKLARALRLSGEPAQACGMLDELPARFPDASAVTRSLAETERSRAQCG